MIWETVRRNDSRAIKKSVATFSSDPLNLTNIHSYKASSAQSKAVGLALNKKAKHTCILTAKVPGNANKPSKSRTVVVLQVSLRGLEKAGRAQWELLLFAFECAC